MTMTRWREEDKTVFLHCVAGESRTPTIAAAYLAERFRVSGPTALGRLQGVLPLARPNSAFVAALARLWPALP